MTTLISREKLSNKKFGWKTRENVGVLSKLNFGQKFETLSFSEEEYFEEYQEAKNWTLDFGKSSMSLVYCGFQQVQQIINCLKSCPAFNIEIVNPIKLYPQKYTLDNDIISIIQQFGHTLVSSIGISGSLIKLYETQCTIRFIF